MERFGLWLKIDRKEWLPDVSFPSYEYLFSGTLLRLIGWHLPILGRRDIGQQIGRFAQPLVQSSIV